MELEQPSDEKFFENDVTFGFMQLFSMDFMEGPIFALNRSASGKSTIRDNFKSSEEGQSGVKEG